MHSLALMGGLAAALAFPSARADETRARLAYLHGDTTYSIASDGSDRRKVANGLGAVPSPSGDALAFVRDRGESRSSIWVSAPDGSHAHELAGGPGAATQPVWSPDGTRIAFSRVALGQAAIVSTIEVVRRDGTDARTVVRLRATEGLFTVTAPVWTPDGGRLLYTRTRFGKDEYAYDIHSVALGGGGDALFLRDASGGAFSHDGTRLAFADSSRVNGRSCGSDECYPKGELAVAAADGTGRRVLLRTSADESDPSWSPDDSRIAFSSGRNTPEQNRDETEIYTIAPDGSCLTWLTNGAPASAFPVWLPGPGTAAPPLCGAIHRPPLAEVAAPAKARASWWVGRRMGSALLSGTQGTARSAWFRYEDCAAFDPGGCLPLFLLGQSDTCARGVNLDARLRSFAGLRRARGGAIVAYPRGEVGGAIFTGRSLVRLQLQTSAAPGRLKALFTRVVAALRPAGGKRAAKLPPPRLPARSTRLLPAPLRAGVRSC